ncbi:hypothetical protein [Streptomyces sp. LN549]|uniref:hypothetical protein n=1 Tax=Streptomyces sp. LN549 TaxID=3112979 RepID=UPI003713F654
MRPDAATAAAASPPGTATVIGHSPYETAHFLLRRQAAMEKARVQYAETYRVRHFEAHEAA